MRWKPGLAETAIAAGRPLVAGIYSRVSKDRAGLERSVGQQDEANIKACTEIGAEVGGRYLDNDLSASIYATKPRPDWERLCADVAAGKLHLVILWEVSRGDRDDLDWITFLHLARRLGVWIHITSHHHTYNPRRRRDYKTLAEEGLDSADESSKISDRILRDVEASARQGRPHGQVAYGYRREYGLDGHGKRQIVAQLPDDEPHEATGWDGTLTEYTRAGVVREIVGRTLRGESRRGIANDLNWRGIPSPSGRLWRDTTVREIALNPTYAGLRHWNGEVVAEGTWPPLVSRTDHYAVVAMLSDPARKRQRDSAIRHLGSGLFVCGVCQQVVRTVKQRYRDEFVKAYSCWPTRGKWPDRPPGRQTYNPDRRDVTEAELIELRSLEMPEQTARAYELWQSGVTQTSMADGLGVKIATFNRRIAVFRRRREGIPEVPAPATDNHVQRRVADVDDFVQRALWLRLARPDIVELLAEDERAETRSAELLGEIAAKQKRLDDARDAYAEGAEGMSLAALMRIEARLEPEIKQARAQLNQARIAPVLDGLVLPDVKSIEAAWWKRTVPQRREVIRTLIERVEILPLAPGGLHQYAPEESVRITWRKPAR